MIKPILHQQPLFLMQDGLSRYLERQIRRMTYDDALHALWCGYRLEYLALAGGYPQYRLYRWDRLVGFVDWRSPKRLPEVQKQVACYLAGIGYTTRNTRLILCGAQTAIDANTQRLPRLMSADGWLPSLVA